MGGPLGRSVLSAALGPVPIPRGIDLGGDIHGRLLHHRLTWRNDRGHGFIPYGIMPRTDVSAERLSRTADDILPRHVSAPRGGRRFRLSGSAVRQGRDCQSSRRWPGGLAVSRRTGERPHRQKGKRHHERGCPFSRCGKHGTCADRHAVASMFVSHCTRTRRRCSRRERDMCPVAREGSRRLRSCLFYPCWHTFPLTPLSVKPFFRDETGWAPRFSLALLVLWRAVCPNAPPPRLV